MQTGIQYQTPSISLIVRWHILIESTIRYEYENNGEGLQFTACLLPPSRSISGEDARLRKKRAKPGQNLSQVFKLLQVTLLNRKLFENYSTGFRYAKHAGSH